MAVSRSWRRLLLSPLSYCGFQRIALLAVIGIALLLLYSGQYTTVMQSPPGYIGREEVVRGENLLKNNILHSEHYSVDGEEDNPLGLNGWWAGHSRWTIVHDISETSKLVKMRSNSPIASKTKLKEVGEGEEVTASHFFIKGGKHSIHSLFQYIPLSGEGELKFSVKVKHEFRDTSGDARGAWKEEENEGGNNLENREEGAVHGKLVEGDDGKSSFVKVVLQTFFPDISATQDPAYEDELDVYATSANSIPMDVEVVIPIQKNRFGLLLGIICVRCKNLHVIDPMLLQHSFEGKVTLRSSIRTIVKEKKIVNPINSLYTQTFMRHSLKSPPLLSIVTQVSLDRISLLNYLPHVWNGGLGLAVYSNDGNREWVPKYLEKSLARSALGESQFKLWNVSLSLGEPTQAYPINALRNIASDLVSSPFVFPMDADFVPSRSLLFQTCVEDIPWKGWGELESGFCCSCI
eukprot:m.38019 g.38019  ORF g.38019 m.38019 type:complete len:463 (+) comp6772_c0_seq3:319-1707(+)